MTNTPKAVSFDNGQCFPSKQHRKRYAHLERFSLAAVTHAVRTSHQLTQISAMLSAIARNDASPDERKALLLGLETLAQGYASEARMDMEHMSIAQMRYTPRWKAFKKCKQ
ncbi:hypothetical protein [Paraburkholderia humisilvae]|uniref:Uncharacterized protein n=1 Tax=Paraburkholderia humisilvae TaxID=627669 RepID=A0A6J5DFC0_9BURK|nr:hypothetical protein [Paraburkholderia humisilvae]CAB3751862.1 hypothetical protein LMG29542_01571 [Paraburkholderia humisilvae]